MPPPIIHFSGYLPPHGAPHRFPMGKYEAVRAALKARGLLVPGRWLEPSPASAAHLARVHDPAYVSRVFALALSDEEQKRIGLPRRPEAVRRARLSSGGTLLAAITALKGAGIALNTAGGSHHAGPEGGAGFSTFNDVAAAGQALLDKGHVGRVLIVDCDVHQGDGTARIFEGDPRVFTLSLHGAGNYPFEKARSTLDVPLADGLADDGYLAALEPALAAALSAGPYDLAFYNAGVDVHAEDRLGRLALSDDGIRRRDRMVLSTLLRAGLPTAAVMGGGYCHDVDALAARHSILFEEADRLWRLAD